ncbi:MAG: GNAT family N-acetyltransferase [Kiloniellales bacterium]|nr:GNAT family N-acetyltransferase [Kiloniellales bacterium]
MTAERKFTTRSGRRMRLRPIQPDDAAALQRAYARLDVRDKRARLFVPVPQLTDETAQRFCTIDEDHELCFVLEADDEPGEIMGGGRLMGAPASDSAEFAVSLRSDLKGQGLGTALLKTLLEVAPERGFKTVWGSILADNHAMRALAEKLGFQVRRDPDDPSLVMATIDVSRA